MPTFRPNLIPQLVGAIDASVEGRVSKSVPNATIVLRRSLELLNAVLKEYGAFKMLTGVKTMGQVRAISRVRRDPYSQLTSYSSWRTCDFPCRLTTLG